MSASVEKRAADLLRKAERWQDGRHQRPPQPSNLLFGAVVGLSAMAIFALDTFTTMSSAIAVLYLLVLVAAEGRMPPTGLRWLAAGCAMLSVTSFLTDHDLLADGAATGRLGMSLLAIVITALLLERNIKARQRFQAQALLLDATTDAIVLRDLFGRVLLWNRGAEQLFGISRHSAQGRVHHELLDSAFRVSDAVINDNLMKEGTWVGEIRQVRPDGVALTVESRWTLQRDHRMVPWAVLETSTDLSARKAAERALVQSERRYRDIFDTLAVAVLE